MCPPQTSYSQNAIPGQPGQPYDSELSNQDIVDVVAGVNIPFGTLCELNASGLAVPVLDSTTGASFNPQVAGIALGGEFSVEQGYVPFTVPDVGTGSSASGWLKGQVVSFMRRGRIWVLGDASGTSLRYGAINVHHSSDGTHLQGVFTFAAVSATAGNEIDVAPSCTVWNPTLIGGATGMTFTDPFGNVFTPYIVEIHV